MDVDDELRGLNFGVALHVSGDGTFHDSDSDSGSPLQLHKAAELSPCDREPVVIPPQHPLALSVPRKVHQSFGLIPHRSPLNSSENGENFSKNIKDTTELARETARDSRSLLDQSNMSARYNNRSALGQLGQIRGLLDCLEDKMDSEKGICNRFWKSVRTELDGCVHPSLHVFNLAQQVGGISARLPGHAAVAARLRQSYEACTRAEASLLRGDCHHARIHDLQAVTNFTSAILHEKASISVQLSSVLFQVYETLSLLGQLAPPAFRVQSGRATLGSYVEQTLGRLRTVDWAVSRQLPPVAPGQTPTASQSTRSSISRSTSTLFSFDQTAPSQGPRSSLSLQSTQAGQTTSSSSGGAWNPTRTPIVSYATGRSLSSFVLTANSTQSSVSSDEPPSSRTEAEKQKKADDAP